MSFIGRCLTRPHYVLRMRCNLAHAFLDSQLTYDAASTQGKFDEANRQYLRAIESCEMTPGADHADLATWLNKRAGLLEAQVGTVITYRELARVHIGCRFFLSPGRPLSQLPIAWYGGQPC